MFFKANVSVKGLDKLKQHIELIEKLSNIKDDKKYQEMLQKKCMEILEKVMNERLTGNDTNSLDYDVYRSSNHLEPTDTGFIIYNDARIPVEASGKQNVPENYEPDSQFNLAMAIEYGVGVVGMTTNNPDAWAYNINGYNFGWYLPSEIAEMYGITKGQTYSGYAGYEIYHFTAEKIMQEFPNLVAEYIRLFKVKGG